MNKLKFINAEPANISTNTDQSSVASFNQSVFIPPESNRTMSVALDMQCSVTDLSNDVFETQNLASQRQNQSGIDRTSHQIINDEHHHDSTILRDLIRSETSENIVIDDEPVYTNETEIVFETPAITSTQNKSPVNAICLDDDQNELDRSQEPDEDGFVLVRESNKSAFRPAQNANLQSDDGLKFFYFYILLI
jgi:hypothetical protein